MKININVAEEMQIVAAIQERMIKLESMSGDNSSQIKYCRNVLEKIDGANYKQAQEIMGNEG